MGASRADGAIIARYSVVDTMSGSSRLNGDCLGAARQSAAGALLLSQDLLHGPTLRKFIHELVQVPDVAHERVLDLLDSNAADDAGDHAGIGMQRWRFAEEGLEVFLSFNLLRELPRAVARQPADDVVHLLPPAPFHFGLLDVVWIYAGEGRR